MQKGRAMQQDIQKRTFDFGLRVINVVENLPNNNVGNVLGKQVLRSGTSIGANVEEADAAYSKAEFIYKINIALKESRETHYWLRLIDNAGIIESIRLAPVIRESEELKKILGAIASSARGTSKL